MDYNEIWEKIKTSLMQEKNIDPTIFNRYIKGVYIYKIINGVCLIVTKNIPSKNALNQHLFKTLLKLIKKITNNKNLELKIITKDEVENNTLVKEEKIKNLSYESEKTLNQSDKYTFKNFIEGPHNRAAILAAQKICEKPGREWNPLFIYGNSGLGKTHLLYAIQHKILSKRSKKYRVRYLTSEQFGKDFLMSVTQSTMAIEKFKESFNNYDILLLDDVQFLAKRVKTNEVFFNIFNNFITNHKQIVMTSDKHPEELNGFEERLVSRFQSGLSLKLEKLEIETTMKIIKSKLKILNFDISMFDKEALLFFAKTFCNDIRKLEGGLNRIIFYSIINNDNQKISLETVEEAFKNNPKILNEKPSTKKIMQVVCENYGISIKMLLGRSRVTNVVNARHLAMYFVKTILDESYKKIGSDFGNKDHSTVVNACKKVSKKIDKNTEYAKYVEKLKDQITNIVNYS